MFASERWRMKYLKVETVGGHASLALGEGKMLGGSNSLEPQGPWSGPVARRCRLCAYHTNVFLFIFLHKFTQVKSEQHEHPG